MLIMKFSIPEYIKEEEKKKREREIQLYEELEYMYELGLYNPHEDAGDRI